MSDWNPLLNLISALGLVGLCAIAWLGSENRRLVPWRTIAWGLGLQLAVGLLVFVLPATRDTLIAGINNLLNGVLDASEAGSRFIFGSIIVPDPSKSVGPGAAGQWILDTVGQPFVPVPGSQLGGNNLNLGYILAFRALPQVIFFSGLIALLYRLNLIQPIVRGFAWVFQRTLNISGAESLAGAANIFVGIESAIAVKPFLLKMTRSELCAILASCFGSIASSVLALYAGFLRPVFPSIVGHLVSASILTIPACFVLSKILVPEQGHPETLGSLPPDEEDPTVKKPNPIDSLILGCLDGVRMAVGIAAVLIGILGVVALFNTFFAWLGGWGGPVGAFFGTITLQNLLGMIFLPLTFLTGVSLDWNELWQSSVLIGSRLLETNVPPYIKLGIFAQQGILSDRALLIVSYVLCGFTHFASYGIFVGGLAALIPERRGEVSALGFKALWAGTLATLMTGAIAGLLYTGNAASVLGIGG